MKHIPLRLTLLGIVGIILGMGIVFLPAQAACTNPSPLPSGFSAPCPVFSLSANSVTQAQTLTLSATPQAGTDYILTTAYISQGSVWNPYTLSGNNAAPSYSSSLASLTLSSTQLQALSLGTHYAVTWDWLWDATAQCYKGPGLNQCNTGQWRVQTFTLTATYAYSQSAYYAYSQSSYYTYSQSAYTGGTNYTVKAGGGGNFTTIQACSNAAVAGDTCTVFAGTYAGWTQTKSGSPTAPITFTVNPGDTVNITSNVTVTNTSHVTIGALDSGGGCANNGRTTGAGGANPSFSVGGCFVFQNAGINGPSCGSGNHVNFFHFAYNTSRGNNPRDVISFQQSKVVGQGGACGTYTDTTSNNNYFGHNDVNWNIDHPAAPFCNNQVLLYGNHNLYEYNDMQGTGAQHLRMGGSFNISLDNYVHDDNGNVTLGCGQSPEHIDFQFQEGGDEPALSFSLQERSIFKNCSNDGQNCKFAFARADGSVPLGQSDTVLVRYNYVQNIDGSIAGPGDHNDGSNTTPNWHMYNNTVATESLNSNSGACGTFDSGVGTELNSICYNSQGTNGFSPIDMFTAGSFSNGDIAFDTACGSSCTWNGGVSTYINEPTYAALHNKNPLFANYPTDGTLSAGSPALAGGVTYTTVSSGCGSTSLVVADARFFQAGFGPTGNLPSYTSLPAGDVIRVANSTYQITAVNYTTKTLTTATSVSCSTGDPVSLYKLTDGTVVFPLSQSSPDVGAFP